MEFYEKLQELRKQKGLTQEELAANLFVSRTAVSKWESARGYPGIDSLKAIAKFFGVTIDELLSGDELLSIAEEDHKAQKSHLRDLVFGLLDGSVITFFFLPFFGQEAGGMVKSVSLLSLTQTAPYLKVAYFIVTTGIVLSGIAMLALQNSHRTLWLQSKCVLSFGFHVAGVLLFIISSQPYAAVFLFLFLAIKVLMLIKLQ